MATGLADVIPVNPELRRLYGSAWWKAAREALPHRSRKDEASYLALELLRAARWVAGWSMRNSPELFALLQDLQSISPHVNVTNHQHQLQVEDGPPTIETLRVFGLEVDEHDYLGSMPRWTPPETKKKRSPEEDIDVQSQTIQERYNYMETIRLGYGTYPNVLIKFAKRLELTATHVCVVNAISNAKPNRPIEQQWIAARSACSLATVERAIAFLRKKGLLLVTVGKGKFEANRYDLSPLWSKLDALQAEAESA